MAAISPAQTILDIVAASEWAAYEAGNKKQLEVLRQQRKAGGQHGIVATYKRGCRCEECTRANTDYNRALRNGGEPRQAYRQPHGRWKYLNKGCRCDECAEDVKIWYREQRERRKDRTDATKTHGTTTGYVYGCRCDDCKYAHARAKTPNPVNRSKYNPDRLPKHGTETEYRDHGCRCMDCKQSVSVKYGEHGKANTYKNGCHCRACRRAHADANRRQNRARKNRKWNADEYRNSGNKTTQKNSNNQSVVA